MTTQCVACARFLKKSHAPTEIFCVNCWNTLTFHLKEDLFEASLHCLGGVYTTEFNGALKEALDYLALFKSSSKR